MRLLDAEAVRAALPWPALVDALREMFRDGCAAPLRHAHAIPQPDGPEATLLLMPAWQEQGAVRFSGVKIVHVVPGNRDKGLPAVSAVYLLSDAATGQPVAMLDGAELTDRRTAAASVLAGTYLARPDSRTLLVCGTGRIGRALAEAWSAGLKIDDAMIWGRNADHAATLAGELAAHGVNARAVTDLEAAARQADIISCATLATAPLIRGAWVKPGTHIDLVGAFRKDMRETDGALVARAAVFVDTVAGGMAEGGDIVQAIAEGAITAAHVRGDLHALARGEAKGRTSADEITLFKSVGAALEDLAAAILAVR